MPPPPRRRSSRSSSRWSSASPTRARREESGRGAAPARLAPIRSAREEATSLPTAAPQPKPSPPTVTKAAPSREQENKSSETASRAHSPAPASGGSGSSFLGSIKEGFGFGAGSQLGHRAVDGIMGPQTVKNETSASPATAAPAPNTSSMASPTRARREESGRGAAPARLAPIRSAREEATSLPTAAPQPKPSPPTVTKAAPSREQENKSSETASRAHSPAPASGGSGSSFLGSIKEGFGFGAGSQLGHRAVDGIMGPQTVKNETSASPATAAPAPNTSSMGNKDNGVCALPLKTFQECLDSNTDDISKCQFYMDMLCECKKNSGSMINA